MGLPVGGPPSGWLRSSCRRCRPALVLGAAVLHVAWNFAAKRVRRGGAPFVWAYYTAANLLLLPALVIALIVTSAQPKWSWLVAALITAVSHIGYGIVLPNPARPE